ncbi:hypothetical protein Tco_1495264, partial [Tanacetum coccineum]
TEKPYNMAYFVAKLIEFVKGRSNKILPYGMFLTRLYHHVMGDYPHLAGPQYVFYDRAMLYLDAPTTRKPRKDIGVKRGRQYTSSSSSFHHGSSSRRDDDDEYMHDEGTS